MVKARSSKQLSALPPHSSSPHYCGIDVCKRYLDVALHPSGCNARFTNDAKGYAALVLWLKPYRVMMVAAEATGGLELPVLAALYKTGQAVARINPRWVKDFARATGRTAKTDRLDALVIARYASLMEPDPYHPAQANEEAMRAYCARRRQLLHLRTMETNRLKQCRNNTVQQLHQRMLACLNEQLEEIDALLDDLIATDETAVRRKAIIESIPGVGAATARALIADLPELGSLTGKQAAALVGVAPVNRDSGALQGYRCIQGGRAL